MMDPIGVFAVVCFTLSFMLMIVATIVVFEEETKAILSTELVQTSRTLSYERALVKRHLYEVNHQLHTMKRR